MDMKSYRLTLIFLGLIPLILTACGSVQQDPIASLTLTPETIVTQPPQNVEISMNSDTFIGFSYQKSDGTRIMAGKNTLPDKQPLEIPLSGEVSWLYAVPYREGSLWVAVLPNGKM